MLLIAAFGAFLAFLDSTIVNIAFPDIQRYFHSNLSSLSWVLNAYNIVFAAFLVAAGKLADLLGRKRMFINGVVVFTIASGLCAVADSVGQLIAFRVLQGIGAAILVPASLALVVEGFSAERRAHGVNLWGAAGAIASGLGPPIGGALVEASWRWVFLVNLPLGVVAVWLAKRGLVESRASGQRRTPDLRGAGLLAVALGLLTLGLIKGPDWGWASWQAIATLVASAVTMVGFVMSSRVSPAPLIDPAFLRIRSFVARQRAQHGGQRRFLRVPADPRVVPELRVALLAVENRSCGGARRARRRRRRGGAWPRRRPASVTGSSSASAR